MLTITAIKADVGSIGGHTRPAKQMLDRIRTKLAMARETFIKSYDVTHTGDDICLLMVHEMGSDSQEVHDLAWQAFLDATDEAKRQELYGAGQDLLKDAPSGNVRGAGPGAAEITFEPGANRRTAETFLVFTADKCGPGAFNLPLYLAFTSPMYCAGLMLDYMLSGFRFKVVDMEHAGEDLVIELDGKTENYELAVLLRDENRYGIRAIYSNDHPDQQVVSASTDRLHTIAGVYKGKDDPVAVVRTQNIFPAPEEIVSPYFITHFVAGDARGSHHMPLMPVPINTLVAGPYCLPLVSCMAYSVTKDGQLSEGVDIFGNLVWDDARLRAQRRGMEMRQQGFVGPAMLPFDELEYTAFADTVESLRERFEVEH